MQTKKLTQAIVVWYSKTDPPTTLDFIEAVAASSSIGFDAFCGDVANEKVATDWINSGMTKSVRRLKTRAKFDELINEQYDDFLSDVSTGSRLCIATLEPMYYENMPDIVRKAHVSGLNLETTHTHLNALEETKYRLLLNNSLDMSAGKLAAQTAHGFMMATLNDIDVSNMSIDLVDDIDIREAMDEREPLVVLRDAGHTEIEPNSLTAIIVPQ